MEIARRKSDRLRTKKVLFTPKRSLANKSIKAQDHHVTYTLNKPKAIAKKMEAAERTYSVTPQFTKGNLVLVFSAAAYEEFKYITISTLQTQDTNIKSVETKDTNGSVISESYTIYVNNEKLFVLNFYNSTSKVLLNGKQEHVLTFTKSYLMNILELLDRNANFTSINSMIRQSCKQYLDMENMKSQKAVSKHKTSIDSSSIQSKEGRLTPQQEELGNKEQISSNMAINPCITNSTLPTCPICNKMCTNNCKAVGCDTCDQWFHYECENLSAVDIKIIEEIGDDNYICRTCKIQLNALIDKSDNESQSNLDSPTNVRPANYNVSSPQNTLLQIISPTTTENCKRNNDNGSSAMQHPKIMVPGMSKTPTIQNSGNNVNYAKPKRLQLQATKKHGTNTTNTDNVGITNGQHIGNDRPITKTIPIVRQI
ncbi:Hypothetical predicted protein [Mytilus galloprovincialis]|uniref:PHD-type domain-containing protein n=1 Tax=Mytilus galloprovincialis TaxID=29158 RepID=A0A8B6CHG0_MYTGA|nr:Hypothetical predicted protein [Mytilus galloprovincialis]